jgi:hypothetical protein
MFGYLKVQGRKRAGLGLDGGGRVMALGRTHQAITKPQIWWEPPIIDQTLGGAL